MAALVAAVMSAAAPARAAVYLWDGGGPSALWSAIQTAPGPGFGRTNWGGNLLFPLVGSDLLFKGVDRLASTNDLPALTSVHDLSFDLGAGPFVLSGNRLGISGKVNNLGSARQTIALPLTVEASGTWSGGSGGLDLTGGLALGNHSLVLTNRVDVQAGALLTVGETAGSSAGLILRSGSTVTSTDAVLGRDAGAVGTVSLQDAQARWTTTQDVSIGAYGTGVLFVSAGAVSSQSFVFLGDKAGSTGTATITGLAQGWDAAGLYVGTQGTGFLTVDAGHIVTRVMAISGFEGSAGSSARFSGASTTWMAGSLFVGLRDAGTLTVENGVQVTAADATFGDFGSAKGDVIVRGASTRWTYSEKMVIGLAGQASLDLSGGAQMKGNGTFLLGAADVGAFPGSDGSVTVRGAGSLWDVGGALELGWGGRARVSLLDAGHLEGTTAKMLRDASVIVDGAGSDWTLAGALQLLGTSNRVSITNGGAVTAGAVTLGAGSTLVLDGGSLTVASLQRDGVLQWPRGNLTITGAGGAALGAALPRVQALGPGMNLQVDAALTLGAGSVLLLDGGRLQVGTLQLNSGSVVGSAGGLDMSLVGQLRGQGTVAAALSGGAGSRVVAEGTLTLGDAALPSGVSYDGELVVGPYQVILLSAGAAVPGKLVTLGDGGRLAAVNGITLASGRRLDSSGRASVLGAFVNDGKVTAGSGLLSFLNDVSGTGSFSGAIEFRSGYQPGHGVARIDFGGGTLHFAAGSTLTLDLLSTAPDGGYDQLVELDRLGLDGRVRLVFDPAFAVNQDARLQLFGFHSADGVLSADRIDISGFDRARLDFSRLGVDGTLGVSAVPEPATALLMLVGAGVLAWRVRSRPVSRHSCPDRGCT